MIKTTYNIKDTINIAKQYYCGKDKYFLKPKFEEQFPKLKELKNKKEIELFFNKEYKKLESKINIKKKLKQTKEFFNKNQDFLEKNLFKLMKYPIFDVEVRLTLLPIAPYYKNRIYLPLLNQDCLDYFYLHETSHLIWHEREPKIFKKLNINIKKHFKELHDIKEIFASVIINQEIFKDVLKKRLGFLNKSKNFNFDKDYGNYYENYFIKEKGKSVNIVDYFMEFYKKNIKKGFLYVQEEAIKKILKFSINISK
ncbi:MAG: hypothetical protein ISS82_05565 [Nanoarchaeota archaeon]|nr:hypothetical protein [Nanoarchaeota archaeon]